VPELSERNLLLLEEAERVKRLEGRSVYFCKPWSCLMRRRLSRCG
jgi:hypothetical protein